MKPGDTCTSRRFRLARASAHRAASRSKQPQGGLQQLPSAGYPVHTIPSSVRRKGSTHTAAVKHPFRV
jgi:hypothetical protein